MNFSRVFPLAGLLALAGPLNIPASHRVIRPTYTKDVAPILNAKCVGCHRDGQVSPFALQTYLQARRRARLIDDVTRAKVMPPWKPGKCDFAFKEDISLTAVELQTIHDWVGGGAPEGRACDLPKPPVFKSAWRLGSPDMVLRMPKPFLVPSDGPDIYRNFVVATHIPKDCYVKAVDFQPSSRSVVHHCLFYFDATGSSRERDGKDGRPGYNGSMGSIIALKPGAQTQDMHGNATVGSLGAWAVGGLAQPLPEGCANYVPENSDIILSTHFHPSGRPESEQSTLALYFAKKPPTKRFEALVLPSIFGYFTHLDIPIGDKDYVISDVYRLPVDCDAFGVAAHAHYLGKSMKLTATYPDGDKKILFTIPAWDFNWQQEYVYQDYPHLPAGTMLKAEIHYDNSADNPYNPSTPVKRVKWGEQTTDEMGAVMLMVIPSNQKDYKALHDSYGGHVLWQALSSRHVAGN